jgi:lysophospholipase L1-like esterase
MLPGSHVVNVTCDGDSITSGTTYATATQRYPYVLSAQAGAAYGGAGAITNLGVSGNTIEDLLTRAAATDATYDGSKQQNILLVMAGTNNLGTSDPNTTFAHLAEYVRDRRATGWLVGIWTLMDFNPRAPVFQAARLIYNQLIRTQCRNIGAAGFIDIGASPEMGGAGPALSANFGADLGHPNPLGYQIMANYAQAWLARTAVYL